MKVNEEIISKIITCNYNEFGNEFGDALVDLKNENQKLVRVIDELKEYLNNELKNIEIDIKEMEKWLDEKEVFYQAQNDIHTAKVKKNAIENILNKLTELKGDNND